jgi:ABC-2 type transport system ATP-binding protein
VGLDPRQIIEIRNLIQSLGGNHTVILSTHILPEVQATCSRVVVIDRGHVVAEDTLAGIANRMQASVRLKLTLRESVKAILPRIQAMSGVHAVREGQRNEAGEFLLEVECGKGVDVRSAIAELCVQERLGLLSLGQDKLSLEDAFVRLITQDEVTRELKNN